MEKRSTGIQFLERDMFRLQNGDRQKAAVCSQNLYSEYEWIWQNSKDGMIILDRDGKIIDVNKLYCELIECSRESILGLQYLNKFGLRRLSAQQGCKVYQIKIKGRKKYLQESYCAISSSNMGEKYLVLVKDITQEIKKKRTLRENKSLLKLGKTYAIAAHEIKTPLTSIKLNLELLKKIIKDEESCRSFQLVKQEVDRLERLVRDILAFSKHSSEVRTKVNLHILIEKIRELTFLQLREKEIKFINNLPSINIEGNERELKSMFMQLIENSIESVSKGGRIEISCIHTDEKVNIYIKDNGKVILEPDEIFNPFFTTKENGTGLGLAIAKRMVEVHKGSIKLLSSRDGENVFFISFNRKSGIDE